MRKIKFEMYWQGASIIEEFIKKNEGN